jgi:hypothetical protein
MAKRREFEPKDEPRLPARLAEFRPAVGKLDAWLGAAIILTPEMVRM